MLERKQDSNELKVNGTENTESFTGTYRGGNKKFINTGYIYCLGSVITIGMFSFGVLIGQFNPIAIIFSYLLNWTDSQNTTLVATTTTAGNFGAMCGAYLAPVLIDRGKRKLIIYANILAIITYAVQAAILNMPVQITAKFFQGICGGAFSVWAPSLLNDFAPTEISGPLGGLNQIQVTWGILLPSLMAWGLPGGIKGVTKEEDPSFADDFMVSDYWRVIQATPALFSLIQIILMLTVFNFDSPKELKKQAKTQELIQVMRKLYTNESEAQWRMQQIPGIDNAEADNDKVGFKQVLTDPMYSKAAWVGILTMTFAQLTGINAICQYSGQIFSNGSLSPFQATATCNIVNFMAPIACMFTLNFVGKRPIMLIAQLICVIGMGGAFYFTVYAPEQTTALLIVCLVFIVGFEYGPGSLGWPYLAEVCHPTAMGLASLANWFWTLVVSLFYPFLNGEWLPEGWVDLAFVTASVVGLIFFWFNFKETRGKTPEQIQKMFMGESQSKKEYTRFENNDEEIE